MDVAGLTGRTGTSSGRHEEPLASWRIGLDTSQVAGALALLSSPGGSVPDTPVFDLRPAPLTSPYCWGGTDGEGGEKIPPVARSRAWRGAGGCTALIKRTYLRSEATRSTFRESWLTLGSPSGQAPTWRAWPGRARGTRRAASISCVPGPLSLCSGTGGDRVQPSRAVCSEQCALQRYVNRI